MGKYVQVWPILGLRTAKEQNRAASEHTGILSSILLYWKNTKQNRNVGQHMLGGRRYMCSNHQHTKNFIFFSPACQFSRTFQQLSSPKLFTPSCQDLKYYVLDSVTFHVNVNKERKPIKLAEKRKKCLLAYLLNDSVAVHIKDSALALHYSKAHSKINRKMVNSIPCGIATPKNFTMKLGTCDWIGAPPCMWILG